MLNPAKIVRSFVNKDVTVYNDKINKGRSIKVSGYTVEDYKEIIQALEKEGYTVKVKVTQNTGWGGYTETNVRLQCTAE